MRKHGPRRVSERPLTEQMRRRFILEIVMMPLLTGLTAGLVVLVADSFSEDRRLEQTERLENLRFVRERSSADLLERPFNQFDLKDQPLSGLKLQNANFDFANLSHANLLLADLRYASFIGTDLNQTNLRAVYGDNSNFSSASLEGAVLDGAEFTNADFSRASLYGASITDAVFDGANFSSTDLTEVEILYFKTTSKLDRPAVNNLSHAQLWAQFQNSVCFNESTVWPIGFEASGEARPELCEPWSDD